MRIKGLSLYVLVLYVFKFFMQSLKSEPIDDWYKSDQYECEASGLDCEKDAFVRVMFFRDG